MHETGSATVARTRMQLSPPPPPRNVVGDTNAFFHLKDSFHPLPSCAHKAITLWDEKDYFNQAVVTHSNLFLQIQRHPHDGPIDQSVTN